MVNGLYRSNQDEFVFPSRRQVADLERSYLLSTPYLIRYPSNKLSVICDFFSRCLRTYTTSTSQIPSARPSHVIDIAVERIPVEFAPNIRMTADLRPQLRLPPRVVPPPEKRTVSLPPLVALISSSEPHLFKMLLQLPRRFRLSQIASQPLEERNTEAIIWA